MVFVYILFILLLRESFVQGVDLNSLAGRFDCYNNVQPNCSQEFIERYPELSRSTTNLTLARTYFLMFTRRNPDKPEMLHECGGRLPPNTNFKRENDLIVIMTPYLVDFCDIGIYREWLYEILKKDDYNVLVIDPGWGTKVDYATAIENIKIAAKQSAIVLQNIKDDQKIKNEQVYLIGHSLAAHGVGFIGQRFHVRRITGVDPAGPGFNPNEVPPEDRLDLSDADFVDVWHCNAGECLPQFGIAYDIGHVNFWVNDGTHQPNCHINSFKAFLKKDFTYALVTAFSPVICYHEECAQYFRASINHGDCKFTGVKCDSYDDYIAGKCDSCGENDENCLIMGFDSKDYLNRQFNAPERYFLSTNKTCPYCDKSKIHLKEYGQITESPGKKESNFDDCSSYPQGYGQTTELSPQKASNCNGNNSGDLRKNSSILHRIIDFVKKFFGF